MSNNTITDDNNITVARLYEILKSPSFLKNLYWNILSDIKEKDTYKFMRGIAERVINQNMEIMEGLDTDIVAEDTHRKKLVAEISMMSYAIDRVFSKILFLKLEKVCKEQIFNIIQDLKNEGKITESMWAKFKMSASKSETSTIVEVPKKDAVAKKKEVPKTPTRVGQRRRKVTNYAIFQDTKTVNLKKDLLDDLKKVNSMKYTEENKNIIADKTENVQKRRSGRKVKEWLNKNVSCSDANPSSFENVSKEADKEDVSDAESEVSFGGTSSSSISSVHTSDLSSFDDKISVSSDDEKSGKKKKIPLNEVLRRYSTDGPSYFSTPKKIEATPSTTPKSKISVKGTPKMAPISALIQSPSENGLSKRTRKPNSRYFSSDNILPCVVKMQDKKKPLPLAKANYQVSSDDQSPQKKKAKLELEDDINVDVVTITQSNYEGNTKDIVKTPAKQPETSKLLPSRSTTRSLTSRQRAPLTLFSD